MIEILEAFALLVCLIPSTRYAIKSQLKIGRLFWIASILIFISAIRRELSFVPKLFIPKSYIILEHSYYWWQDLVLITIALIALVFLVYAWRYVWGVLKTTPKALYVIVITLVITQYLGEHGIGFGHDIGVVIEEVSEATIYLIALVYLWRFKLPEFEYYLCPNQVDASELYQNSSHYKEVNHETVLEDKTPKSC